MLKANKLNFTTSMLYKQVEQLIVNALNLEKAEKFYFLGNYLELL